MTNRKEYYQLHKETLKARTADWQRNNKERLSARMKIYRRNKPEKIMLACAKSRAKKKDIPFDLEEEDIKIPKICPYLEIELKISENKVSNNSPSLDRIDPTKGYIKGNVAVISHLANVVKNKLSKEQLVIFAKNVLK